MKTALQTLLIAAISITLAGCSGGGFGRHHQTTKKCGPVPRHSGEVGPRSDGGVSEPAHSPVSGAPAGSGKLLVMYYRKSDMDNHPTEYRLRGPTGAWTVWTALKVNTATAGITKTKYTYPIEFRRTTLTPVDTIPRMPNGVKVEDQYLTKLLISYN